MHISDGVLSFPVCAGGYAAAASIIAVTIRKIKEDDIPRVAVMTSAFFVASLIHVPLGPTSVHLILNGLVGIILGPAAFVSIFVGLVLQAFLFQHGGITTIGVNAIMMGTPALLAYKLFSLKDKFNFRAIEFIFGAMGGAIGVFLGTVILALALITTGGEFMGVAKYAVLAHLPIMVIEGIITGFIASFLMKVKPEILRR
ncbi:cobalt transporter CbiM [Candidatus Aerophobetes bacterium]|uniref:Cobalt transporter CbiM n=1 Tax=Aerophobetes bacterium TaxID=2030807 RepID=A0A662D779_UNCAE|nr:MAG: cobalt transporter CbiM [Candidatus Aerophobetes bacterium]